MQPIKILIVEAQRTSAEILAQDLKQAGYQIVGIVESGNMAMQTIANSQIDIVLIDILLKGDIDGIVTSEKIKADYNIPIIYLTSLSDRATLKRARKTKPNGYILKPYDFKDLKATIDSAVPKKHNSLTRNLRKVKRKAKLASHKIQKIAQQTFEFPSLRDRDRKLKREQYRPSLPKLTPQDQNIVSTLEREGVYITSLAEFKLPYTKRLIKELITLHPHLYTLSHLTNWRVGIPSLRKFSHAEILFWGLGERLLDIVENYLGLPPLFNGIDIRRDIADAALTDARNWHLDIDDDRMIKVIIYLNNVGKTGGPFEYIPRFLTEKVINSLDYTSGFISDDAIANIVPSEHWKTCAAKAGNIVITDPCNVFHRAKPAKRNRYSITFGYTSIIPKITLSEFKLTPEEWQRITPNLSQRQIACLRTNS